MFECRYTWVSTVNGDYLKLHESSCNTQRITPNSLHKHCGTSPTASLSSLEKLSHLLIC